MVLYYKKSLKLFELSPIADFASVVEGQTDCNLFLGMCLVKLPADFHHTFHKMIHHIP